MTEKSTDKEFKTIFIDIDETICYYFGGDEFQGDRYFFARPYLDKIHKINDLYDQGHRIVYWTARGSRSGIDWYEFTEKQLDDWGVKRHELRCDKPYYDVFIDDKTLDSIDKL